MVYFLSSFEELIVVNKTECGVREIALRERERGSYQYFYWCTAS